MAAAGPDVTAAAVWDVVTPSRLALPGVAMAGFRARATDPVSLTVVPYPAVTLAVAFGGAPLDIGHHGTWQQQDTVIAGLAPGMLRMSGRDLDALQIRLSPLAAHAVLRAPADLDGGVVTLEDVWGRDGRRVADRLRAARSWEDRFALTQAALARRHADGRRADPEVAFAWQQMVRHRGSVRIGDLAAQAGWSRKRLWSRFRAQVGLTPKRAAQLIRFDHAAHRLAAGHSAAVVAADTGYADQPHLHREVASFAQMTPSALALASWLEVDPVAWPSAEYLSAI